MKLSASRSLAQGEPLREISSVSSVDGFLNWTVSLQRSSHIIDDTTAITTRTFNGDLPGLTLRVLPGDLLNIGFRNDLELQGTSRAYVHNEFSAPDESNLHFHGLHVSGELPSDDTSLVVASGESFSYSTRLSGAHMPGTHWMHPHRHGSSLLQTGGGAVSAIIVEDPPGYLPSQLSQLREIVLVVQQFDPELLDRVASQSKDSLFSISTPLRRFLLVNGQIQPEIALDANQWVRFRIVYSGWTEGNLDMRLPGCDMILLAKDGIYIRDFPRSINEAAIPPGGRADVLVKCTSPETTFTIESAWGVFGTIATTSTVASNMELEPWTPQFPNYLQDLRSTDPSPGCSCTTRMNDGAVNGHKFDESHILHQSYLGAVVERELRLREHPYHQHVYPFQLVQGFEQSDYIQLGDWHDTILNNGRIRYQTTDIGGKLMLHCHRLDHEDEGMMAIEQISQSSTSSGGCFCGADDSRRGDGSFPIWAVIALVVAAVSGIAIAFWWWRKKQRRRSHEIAGEL